MTDRSADVKTSDTVIVLERGDPKSYRALKSGGHAATSFCYAAAEATRRRLLPLAQATPDGYRDVIATHEIELDASMKEWIERSDLSSVTTCLLIHGGLRTM